MAQLPDLDTTTAGLTAYWNALDDGGATASDLSLSEMINFPRLRSWESYDNGITGTLAQFADYNKHTSEVVNFRVKSDGWVVVYADPSSYLLSAAGHEADLSTRLHEVIKEIAGLIAPAATFNQADVGVYDYATDAAELWFLAVGANDDSYPNSYIYYDDPVTVHQSDAHLSEYSDGEVTIGSNVGGLQKLGYNNGNEGSYSLPKAQKVEHSWNIGYAEQVHLTHGIALSR